MPAFSRIRSYGLVLLIALAALLTHTYVRAQTPGQDQLEQGARLFAANCAVCHGAKGEGRVGATLAKNWPSIRPDLEVRNTIENGIAGSPMPAWGQSNGGPLTEGEIDALVAYILSWETGGSPEIPATPTYIPRPAVTPPPNVEGDPYRGAVLFDQNCAVCHGSKGEGRIGATLAKPWSSIRPDLDIKSIVSNGVKGSPMPAWSQANGGPLTEADINDLVAFVLTLKPAIVQGPPEATPAPPPGPLASWFGILLAIVLLILVVWIAIAVQIRGRSSGD